MNGSGSLVVVGTGIKVAGDITVHSQAQIVQADIVFYVVPDKMSKQWLASLNSNTVDLGDLYQDNKSRLTTYNDMADTIVNAVQSGLKVCAAFYGHPGVFVYASHQAISRLKKEGYQAKMEPGISAEDCLFADIGIDPGETGCMSIEATQFLFYKRNYDPHALLVLWQIGLIGDHTLKLSQTNNYQRGIEVLVQELSNHYPPDHEVIIYEAATISLFAPRIERVALSALSSVELTAISTLVIPPYAEPEYDQDILKRLGVTPEEIEEVLSEKTN